MKSDAPQATLQLECNPHSLTWHPGGKSLVLSNLEDSEADRIEILEYVASPAKLREAKDRQLTTQDEVCFWLDASRR